MKEKHTYTTNSYFYMEYDNLKKNHNSIHKHVHAKSLTLNEGFRQGHYFEFI